MPEKYCFIENCKSEFPQFLVPKDKVRRKKFLEILGVTNYREGRRLCKNHFHPNDIKISKNGTEYLQRNALPKSTSMDTAAGIPGDCTWRCMDRDLMCHRVVLAAHSQFLREMLKETDSYFICTPEIKSSVIECILHLLYSGITSANISEISELEITLRDLGIIDIYLASSEPEPRETILFSKQEINVKEIKFDSENNLLEKTLPTSELLTNFFDNLSSVMYESKINFKSVSVQCGESAYKRRYSRSDFIKATNIWMASPKAYKYLRNQKLLKLPHQQTVMKKFSAFEFKPGLENESFSLLESKMKSLNENERSCALVFDEMKLTEEFSYCQRLKHLFQPSKYANTFLIRGLTHGFKLVLAYDFDVTVDKKLIESVILKCESVGAKVRCIVFDLGNKTLVKDLKIASGKYFFENPLRKSDKVYCIPDSIHGFKNLRNHIVDYGIRIKFEEDYVTLDKSDFRNVLAKDGASGELRLAHKVHDLHLDAVSQERQRTYLAVQLLSASVANLFQKFGFQGKARLIHIFNDFFDVMDSKFYYGKKGNKMKSGFGVHFELQLSALHSMKNVLEKLEYRKEKGSVEYTSTKKPFQHGLIATINSVIDLFEELKNEGFKYLLTGRCNQDCLENIFSVVRQGNGAWGHPNAPEFCRRLRKICITGNIVECMSDCNSSVSLESNAADDPILTPSEDFLQSLNPSEKEHLPELIKQSNAVFDESEADNDMKFCIDAIQYVAGWLARKCNLLTVDPTPGGWIYLQSRLNLKEACPQVFKRVKLMNIYFNEIHGYGESIQPGPNIIDRTIAHIIQQTGEEHEVAKKFVKVKFFMRVSSMNKKLVKEKKLKAKEKGKRLKSLRTHTKIGQFCN